MQTLTCEIDIIKQMELPISQSITVSIVIGNFIQEVGTIRLENPQNSDSGIKLELLFLLIPAIATFIFVALACGTVIGCAIVKIKGTRCVYTLSLLFTISRASIIYAEP